MKRRIVALFMGGCFLAGCLIPEGQRTGNRPADDGRPEKVTLETTGYCSCGSCCGWRRNWRFQPVYASGNLKGRPKEVGVTASGSRARHGTIAADTDMFPFGTMMEVPGYGSGVVEDRGAAIRDRHIDLYFASHRQALEWGRKTVTVTVWGHR